MTRKVVTNTILLIEDNPGDAMLVEEMLAEWNELPTDFVWAKRFQEGVDLLRKGGIDLVLLDLNLPDSRGIETFISLHEVDGNVPIIVLSGHGDQEMGIRTVKRGAQDYLQKDEISLALLGRAIRYALERHKTRQELTRSFRMIHRQNAVLGAINRVILEANRCKDDEVLGQVALSAAQEITGSQFGWIDELNESGRVDTFALSDPGWQDCGISGTKKARAKMMRDLEVGSYWGRVIRSGTPEIVHNPGADPDRKGTPAGHPEIRCFLGVPLLRGDRTVGVISLANSRDGFDMDDQEAVQAISVAFVESLDRLRTESSLRESEEKFRGLSEASSDIVWEIAPDGNLRYCSPKLFDVLGYRPDDLIGTNPLDVIPVEERESVSEQMRSLFADRRPFHDLETTIPASKGNLITLETNGGPYFDPRGELKGFRGISRDISYRQKTEVLQSQLDGERIIVQQMRDMERMKAEVVETVTHELRTPMTPLRSSVDMLLDGTLGEVNDRQKEMLRMMQRNILRLSRFSSDVLTLSRLDAGRYRIRPRKIQVANAVGPVIELLKRKAEEKSDILDFQGEDALAAFADPDALGQVITNLVDNAISHNPEGVHILVTAESADDDKILVQVTDDGKGIPNDALQNIWDRFYQADRQAGPGYRGTGLGLTVCRMLMENMGGSINVHSVLGKGTTFRILLPSISETSDGLFGRIALREGFVTDDQLQQAVNEWTGPNHRSKQIGAIMVESGYITADERDSILAAQTEETPLPDSSLLGGIRKVPPLGLIALEAGDISQAQLVESLKTQQRLRDMGERVDLGGILVRMGYVDAARVVDLLEQQGLSVIHCDECGSNFNFARGNRDMTSLRCPRCSAVLHGNEGGGEPDADGVNDPPGP